MESQLNRARQTFKYDCLRGSFNSIIYTGFMTLALLVAIRYHDAPNWVKSFITSADSIGRLITPITLYMGLRLGLPTNILAKNYMVLLAGVLIFTAFSPSMPLYALSIILAYIVFAQPPQLMLHIYSKNYLANERGSRVSMMFVIATTIGVATSFLFGHWLNKSIENFRYEFIVMAICAVIASRFLKKIPSVPLELHSSGNAWENFSLAWRDRLFGWLLSGYFLLGIANSMVIPIRIEYMANLEYEINASNLEITLINVVIPGLSMILSTRVWGFVFDKFHFITTRLLINACFVISFFTFFTTKNLYMLALSNVVNGFALAGGMIVWNLWVTKVAPEGKAPAYMSTHSSFSGIKGLLAPFLGYQVLAIYSPKLVGITAAGLMILSSLMFAAVWRSKRID